MLQTLMTFIRENPALTALLVFIVFAVDTFYVYRTLKRAWRKSSLKSAGRQPAGKVRPGPE